MRSCFSMLGRVILNFKFVLVASLLLSLPTLVLGQEGFVSFGGSWETASGSISYSGGQLQNDQATSSDQTTLMNIGLQIPYESYEILGISSYGKLAVDFDIQAFPNPTSNFIHLNIKNLTSKNYTFSIYNSNGSLVLSGGVVSLTEPIELRPLSDGIYCLTLFDERHEMLGSVRIIKKQP